MPPPPQVPQAAERAENFPPLQRSPLAARKGKKSQAAERASPHIAAAKGKSQTAERTSPQQPLQAQKTFVEAQAPSQRCRSYTEGLSAAHSQCFELE